MPQLTFGLVNLLVLTGAISFASRLKLTGVLDRLLAIFTLALSQIVLSVLLAGVILRQLRPVPVLLINLTITLLAWFLPARKYELGTMISVEWLPGLVQELRRQPWVLILMLLVAAEMLWTAFLVYLLPPHAYDALYYHLVSAAFWLQAKRIGLVPFNIWSNVYPANMELLFTWLMLFLHSDTWVDVGQLFVALGGILASIGLASGIGISRPGAVAVGSLFFLTPIVLTQVRTNYTDVALASMFLTCFYFLSRYWQYLNLGYVALAGLAGGIALGTKFSGMTYVGIGFLFLLAHMAIVFYRGRVNFKQAAWSLGIFGVTVLLLGAYWYVNNWLAHQNPLYPFRVNLLGRELFTGYTTVHDMMTWLTPRELLGRTWWMRVWLSWQHEPDIYLYDQRLGGFGLQWLYVGFPAVVMFSVYTLCYRRDLFLRLVLPFGVIFWTQPSNWWSRYTMLVVVFGAISFVYLIEKLKGRWLKRLLQVGCVTLVLISVYFSSAYFSLGPETKYPTLELVARTLKLTPQERTLGNLFRAEFSWVDRIEAGARIGVDPDHINLIYPLFGPQLQHEVMNIEAYTQADFLGCLRQKGIEYIFTLQGTDEDSWAQQDLAHFHQIDATGDYRAYQIKWSIPGEQ